MRRSKDKAEGHENGSRPTQNSASDVRKGSVVPLILCLGVLFLGFTMEATPQRATWMGIEGPPCPSRLLPETWRLHEAGCPGCGLTRATAMAIQGKIKPSLRLHPAGVLVTALATAGALIHSLILVAGRRPRWIDRTLRAGRVLLLLGLTIGWLTRLF
ncbi:MAG: hypothetical protein ACJA2W_000135 [Planctomycetota bacterium]|jgi:hypothetical protein